MPPVRVHQEDLTLWISRVHQLAERTSADSSPDFLETIQKLFLRYGVKSHQISQRYFENDDVLKDDNQSMDLYKIAATSQQGADIYRRTLFFADRALGVFRKFYSESTSKPDHIIHVTCTGYISPSAPQRLVAEPNWQKPTAITHAYHMGCYAALPAVRLAQALVAGAHGNTHSPTETHFTTDIVHTEMCGLHMNPLVHTPEQMVVQTLFADGHVKYTASSAPDANNKNLRIIATHERILPDSHLDMSWTPTTWGMQMNLSREVPAKIKSQLKVFFQELLEVSRVSFAEAMKSQFAIHPGGPKIIDAVQEVLELSDAQTSHSKKVLLERGNMSSATLPHVWTAMIQDPNIPKGSLIVSFAFGPGLTLFGSIFEVC